MRGKEGREGRSDFRARYSPRRPLDPARRPFVKVRRDSIAETSFPANSTTERPPSRDASCDLTTLRQRALLCKDTRRVYPAGGFTFAKNREDPPPLTSGSRTISP